MIQFRAPVQEPLYPIGYEPVPPGAFRVTRSFGDLSFPQYGAHDGLDIGNGRDHDPIFAIAAGTVTQAAFVQAAGGAAIVRIDHGDGWSSGYAHMDRIDVAVNQNVTAGTPIGILGSTGWTSGAHLHFDITLNGVRQDPWPLLNSSTGDDDPVYNPKDLLDLYGLQAVTKDRANLRAKQGVSYPILTTFGAGTKLTLVARVVGEPVNGNIEWFETKAELSGQVQTGFVHSSAVDVIPQAPTGITQAQLEAAKSAGFTEAKAKARVAVEGITP